jgi:hypothetical protein
MSVSTSKYKANMVSPRAVIDSVHSVSTIYRYESTIHWYINNFFVITYLRFIFIPILNYFSKIHVLFIQLGKKYIRLVFCDAAYAKHAQRRPKSKQINDREIYKF